MSNRLHVGNLATGTTDTQIQKLFNGAGTVVESALIQDRITGEARGFAFVTMSSQAEAAQAIQKFNGADLNGNALTVTVARPREERMGGGPRDRFRPR